MKMKSFDTVVRIYTIQNLEVSCNIKEKIRSSTGLFAAKM